MCTAEALFTLKGPDSSMVHYYITANMANITVLGLSSL